MTRSEKIDLLENFSTFLAANGYMDEDWRSEPPFAIDEFLRLTTDPVEPTAKEGEQPWELQIIKNIWRRAYLDSEEDHVKILKEYSEKIASQERSKAIQQFNNVLRLNEPWPLVNVLQKLVDASAILLDKGYDGHGWEEIHGCIERAKKILSELEKLKTKSI